MFRMHSSEWKAINNARLTSLGSVASTLLATVKLKKSLSMTDSLDTDPKGIVFLEEHTMKELLDHARKIKNEKILHDNPQIQNLLQRLINSSS